MSPCRHRGPCTVIYLLLALAAAGCLRSVYGERIAEITAVEAAYMESVAASAYADAYGQLHADVRAKITPEKFEAFYTVLTETFGPMTGWKRILSRIDKRVPLLEPARYRDPFPPDKPMKHWRSSYRLLFSDHTLQMTIITGWEDGRMVILGQLLCMTPKCMTLKEFKSLRAAATQKGVGELFGVRPKPAPTPKPAMPQPPSRRGTALRHDDRRHGGAGQSPGEFVRIRAQADHGSVFGLPGGATRPNAPD